MATTTSDAAVDIAAAIEASGDRNRYANHADSSGRGDGIPNRITPSDLILFPRLLCEVLS